MEITGPCNPAPSGSPGPLSEGDMQNTRPSKKYHANKHAYKQRTHIKLIATFC